MTKEEIIRNLKYTMEKHKNDTVNTFGTNISVMCKDILDYLEQEPILDKIRAEIMQLDYETESVDYDYNDMVQTEIVHTVCRENVLMIIDKYKAEGGSEE